MHILGCLGVLVLFVFVFALSLVAQVIAVIRNFLFGPSRPRNNAYTQPNGDTINMDNSAKPNNSTNKKKLFEDNEGEYVDYEEVKE